LPSLEADLGRTAHDVAGRTGVEIDLDVAQRTVNPDYQENLVRIVREAVTNAIRHGRAHRVSIQFTGGSQPVLTVWDDGVGFDPAAVEAASGGFGIVCMRERAETLGATLALRSEPGKGATVEIAWR
jgi:signal transduction histidine kinase